MGKRRCLAAWVAALAGLVLLAACGNGTRQEGPADGSQNIPPDQEAAGGEIRAVPAQVGFGAVPVNTSLRTSVDLVNTSLDDTLVISGIAFAPGSSRDFSFEAELEGDGGAMEIPRGEKTSIKLVFTPSAAGPAQAVLIVTNSSENAPELRIEVSGEGIVCRDTSLPEAEFMIDTQIVWGLSDRGQENPSVAVGANGYFVVWEDGRGGGSTDTDIYGTRISADGTVLDPGGIRISASPESEQKPSVASDGTNFLVVWGKSGIGAAGFDVQGARVSADGVVLDPEPIAICSAEEDQLLASVDFDGTNYLVVWLDNREFDVNIYGARVDTSGAVLDPSGIPISTAPQYQKFPAVRFGAGNYLVVWQDERDGFPALYGARVDASAAVLDPEGIQISSSAANQTFATVSFDGSNYLVVWEDEKEENSDIFGARLDASAVLLDAEPIVIASAPAEQVLPSVSFDGTRHFVAWTDSRDGNYDIYGARVEPSGQVLDPGGKALAALEDTQISPSIGCSGSICLLAYSDNSIGWTDVFAAMIGPDAEVVGQDSIHLSVSANSQYNPSAASDGFGYFVAWSSDDEQDSRNIYGRLIGTEHAAEPVPIALMEGDQDLPSVSSDGNGYFVAWVNLTEQGRGIYGCIVDGQGQPGEPCGILIYKGVVGNFRPGLAFSGTEYFVVWTAWEGNESVIYGAFVTPGGEVLEDRVTISTGEGDAYEASVVFDGTNYFVVWTWQRSPFDPLYVVGRRVGRSGEIIDSRFKQISGEFPSSQPAVAFGRGLYLVAWRYPGVEDIHGVLVTTEGKVLDENGFFGIAVAEGEQANPAASLAGANYIVAWEDGRNQASRAPVQVYGCRVSPEGWFRESFPVSSIEGDATAPAVAANLCGDSLFLYSGWTAREGYYAIRLFGRFFARR